jgi:hypothetical protein
MIRVYDQWNIDRNSIVGTTGSLPMYCLSRWNATPRHRSTLENIAKLKYIES